MTRADLKDLIRELEALTGQDSKTDRAIFMWENGYTRIEDEHDSAGPRLYAWKGKTFAGEITSKPKPAYTASIDAAVALVERCLPRLDSWQVGWANRVLLNEQAFGILDYRKNSEQEPSLGATPAIAILIALFRGLEAEGGSDAQT